MKRLISTLVFISATLIATSSFAYNSDPKTFINELLGDVISTLNDKNLKISEKNKKVETIAIENVDIVALSMYTLGPIRKTLDEETLNRYKVLFEKYFLKSLTSRLTDYASQKFEITGAEQKSETTTIINSKILETKSQPEIKIDWRIYIKNPDRPLIRDLIVEGLSLAKTQKEEFTSILNSNNNDINILFLKLEEFVETN